MATYKQVNKNTNIVSVGRTAPVPRGQQSSQNSLPVVLASDASAIPVVEQNKVASEVALSLLGIPRSEVALGIFADVNTYDVNPSEWSIEPADRRSFTGTDFTASGIRKFTYEGYSSNSYNWGLTHVPEEAGAMIEAPAGETTVLTSKRFFRYQPGRVSSATFGVKASSLKDALPDRTCRNPAIRKYGIYDKFDGYYWETRETGRGDQFSVTRRTQSIIDFRFSYKDFGTQTISTQTTDYGIVGKGKESNEVRESIMNSPIATQADITTASSLITLANVFYYGDSPAALGRHFKDGVIPKVGMTVRNITIGASTDPQPAGYLADTDNSPLFRESTIVTAVVRNGNDLQITLNNNTIDGAISEIAAGGTAINPADSTSDTITGTGNGRLDSPFGPPRKLKFSFSGENVIVRDNLPLVQAGIYDPSLLNDRTEYVIESATTDGVVTFPKPSSASGLTGADIEKEGMIKYDDSPGGLYVANVFKFGQIVEYTTDATNISDANGGSFLNSQVGGVKNIFFINAIDTYNNSIELKNIAVRGSTASGGVDSPTNVTFNTDSVANFTTGGITTKHFIKTPVPFLFPEVEYDEADGLNMSDVMFPYTRSFSVFSTDATKPQQDVIGNHHRSGNATNEAYGPGCLQTVLADSQGNKDNSLVETYKSEINDLNSGLSCCHMKGGRTYKATENSTNTSTGTVRKEIHRKCSGWRYWIDDNVNPEYWGVYEYKVPRSRFSFESLNGNTDEAQLYSDVVKDGGLTRYPGQTTIATEKKRSSVWDIDFSNVIMKKIEFSWYGAVGALFLAYVPTGTGEARWVRVHHLRCSNQLKTASLGNATLPLTYTVYGGGVPKQYGRSTFQSTSYASGLSVSEFITKYGSSYYIDGGDRGTVRLFNYAKPSASKISSSRLSDEIIVSTALGGADASSEVTLGTTSTNTVRFKGTRNREDIYVGSTVTFGTGTNLPQAQVIHVERQGKFNSPDAATNSPNTFTVRLDRALVINSPATFLLDAPYTLFGITSKTNIQSSQDFLVRNRVQVYPTKLSVGQQTGGSVGQKEPVSLSLTKNAIFQDNAIYKAFSSDNDKAHKQVRFVGTTDAALELSGSGLPTRLSKSGSGGGNVSPNPIAPVAAGLDSGGGTSAGPYYTDGQIGDKIYGWARVTDNVNEFSLFGRLEVVGISASPGFEWDFIPEDSFTGTVRFVNRSLFTHAYQYYNELGGFNTGTGSTIGRIADEASMNNASSTSTIERLSSITVNNETRRPIPGTGTKVATFFLQDGSDYFDLQPYFDYNKDYISFPLTNVPDNLFIGATINTSPNVYLDGETSSPSVAVSLTWEEQ